MKKLELFTMVCSALENSFVYVSFVQGHFVHRQVHLYSSCIVVKMQAILSLQLLCYINFALACHRTIEKENYHRQDITLLKESNCMGIDIKMPLIWYFLYHVKWGDKKIHPYILKSIIQLSLVCIITLIMKGITDFIHLQVSLKI